MSLKVGGFATLLQVFDMPTSLAFYRGLLGFEALSEVPADRHCDWVWLKRGASELMLNTAYEADARPSAPDPMCIAAHADTSLFFGCDDLDTAYEYLRTAGVSAKAPLITSYGVRQLYFQDPDGYGICLQHPVQQSSG